MYRIYFPLEVEYELYHNNYYVITQLDRVQRKYEGFPNEVVYAHLSTTYQLALSFMGFFTVEGQNTT